MYDIDRPISSYALSEQHQNDLSGGRRWEALKVSAILVRSSVMLEPDSAMVRMGDASGQLITSLLPAALTSPLLSCPSRARVPSVNVSFTKKLVTATDTVVGG